MAFVQMPVALYDEAIEIVEREMVFPAEFHPSEGQWFFDPCFGGMMPIGPVVFDGVRNKLVVTTGGYMYDYTMTLDEWLASHTDWHKAEKPFLEATKKGVANESDA